MEGMLEGDLPVAWKNLRICSRRFKSPNRTNGPHIQKITPLLVMGIRT